MPVTECSAPDLAGFGSREWLRGLLDPKQIESLKYFGGTIFANPPPGKKKSKMVRYVIEEVPKFTPDEQRQLEKIIAAVSAEAKLPAQAAADARDANMIAEGAKLITDGALKCYDCHAWHVDDQGSGPDLTGYASREWMIDFIKNPEHERFYGDKNDRMPLFGEKGELDERQIGLIVDWLRTTEIY
jgi:ubiquinol-cytochrome c reductase cytochrome b subunit